MGKKYIKSILISALTFCLFLLLSCDSNSDIASNSNKSVDTLHIEIDSMSENKFLMISPWGVYDFTLDNIIYPESRFTTALKINKFYKDSISHKNRFNSKEGIISEEDFYLESPVFIKLNKKINLGFELRNLDKSSVYSLQLLIYDKSKFEEFSLYSVLNTKNLILDGFDSFGLGYSINDSKLLNKFKKDQKYLIPQTDQFLIKTIKFINGKWVTF